MPPVTDAHRRQVSELTSEGTWRQFSGGTYGNDGIWQRGTATETAVSVVINRTNQEQLVIEQMPNGVQVEDTAVIYLQDATLPVRVSAGALGEQSPDELDLDGEEWVLWKVVRWDAPNLHQPVEAIVVRRRTYTAWAPPAGGITPTQSQIEMRLREVIALGSQLDGRHVLAGRQTGAGEIFDTHAAVTFISQSNDSDTSTLYSEAGTERDLNSVTYASIRAFYDVLWTGDGAMDVATRCRLWLRSRFGGEELTARGLAYGRVGPVRDRSKVIQQTWVPCAGLDMEVRYVQSFRQQVEALRYFLIGAKLNIGDRTISVDGEQAR